MTRFRSFAIFICVLIYSNPAFTWEAGKGTTSAAISGTNLTIYTYHPKSCREPSILFVFHGLSRSAKAYRDYAKALADSNCLIVYAPLFDSNRFPGWSYQRGGIVRGGVVQPEAKWTVSYVRDLVEWAREREGLPGAPYYLFGHSAGGQFISRVAAFAPPDAERLVIANPSTYVLPSLSEAAAYGFGCLAPSQCVFSADTAAKQLKAYLALPLTIYLGEDDTGDENLNESAAAMRQGSTRFERGQFTFDMAKAVAAANGWPMNWRLFVAPGVGHSAKQLLQSGDAEAAFGLQ